MRFALIIGKYLQFIAFLLDVMTKSCREKEFSSANYTTKHNLFTILVENFARFMGS